MRMPTTPPSSLPLVLKWRGLAGLEPCRIFAAKLIEGTVTEALEDQGYAVRKDALGRSFGFFFAATPCAKTPSDAVLKFHSFEDQRHAVRKDALGRCFGFSFDVT